MSSSRWGGDGAADCADADWSLAWGASDRSPGPITAPSVPLTRPQSHPLRRRKARERPAWSSYPLETQELFAQARLVLAPLEGLVVLDEVQYVPQLFPLLRHLADRRPSKARFLVLGSASPQLLRQGAETLAGRIAWHELPPLSLGEVGVRRLDSLWLRGGLPRSALASPDSLSLEWRRQFVRTFLERDIPMFAASIAPATVGRFWRMLAHWHGQVWNSSELGRAFGVAHTTVQRHLDLLSRALVVRRLPPWFENLAKRPVKAPRVYLSDSGLLHALLDLPDLAALRVHPSVGASWEGFALELIVRHLGATSQQCYFWRTQAGAELDLLVVAGQARLGFEIKRSTSPGRTPSMMTAMKDLRLDELVVVHAGETSYSLGDGIRAIPLATLLTDVAQLEHGTARTRRSR